MKAIVDNNLPVTLCRKIREIAPGAEIAHIIDLKLQDRNDHELRERFQHEPVVWITRDEDFWIDAPQQWAIIWVSCHNPRLSFLREAVAPVIARYLPTLKSGCRLLITEDFASLM